MTTPLSSSVAGGTGAASTTAGSTMAGGKDGLAKVAKQFEAVFLRQMIGSMRQAGLSDDLFGSSAGDQFRDMADGHLADDMAGKGFGIAELLTRQMGRQDATTTTPATTTPAAAATAADGKAGA